MKKLIISISLGLLFLSCFSQSQKRNKTDVFPLSQQYRLGGWVVGAGLTYTQGYLTEDENFNFEDSTTIASQNYFADPKGRIGGFLEVGWFHSFKNPTIIEYMDFGLSYKLLRGREEFTRQTWVNNTMIDETITDNTFSDHILSANFNVTSQVFLSDNLFMTNALGVNADYFLIPSRGGGAIIPGREDKSMTGFYAQLHYKFGIGFRATKKLLIIPTIETPVFGAYPFTHIKSTLDYFNTRFRPFLIGVRFMFIRDRTEDCPPVYNPMGQDPSKYRNREGGR